VRYEPLQEMSWNNAGSFQNPAAFLQLLGSTGTQLVVLPRQATMPHLADQQALYEFARRAIGELTGDGEATLVTGVGDYDVYRLSRSAPLRGCVVR
jgi:hypothetical protein